MAEIVLNGFRKVSDISREVFVELAVGSCLHDEDLPVPPCDRAGVRLFAISSHFLARTVTTQLMPVPKRLRFGDIPKYMCSKHSAKLCASSLKNEVTGYIFIIHFLRKYLCRTRISQKLVWQGTKLVGRISKWGSCKGDPAGRFFFWGGQPVGANQTNQATSSVT